MRRIIIISLALCVAIINYNCEKQAPVSPEINQTEMPQLTKVNYEVTPFTAYALDWWVVEYGGGENTFAQFDLDDPDVTVMPDGTIILRNRGLHSAIGGDLENSSIHAINVVINAMLNPDFNGSAAGKISINATWNGLTGTFKGHFTGGFFSHLFSGEFYAKGESGDFVGMKMRGTMIESQTPFGGNEFKLEGHILI